MLGPHAGGSNRTGINYIPMYLGRYLGPVCGSSNGTVLEKALRRCEMKKCTNTTKVYMYSTIYVATRDRWEEGGKSLLYTGD